MLLRKPRAHAEVYNDLDGDVVNLFRVLRSDRADELARSLELTPFAREEFCGAYLPSEDPVEEARRLVVRSFMGFGSDGFNRDIRTGFRSNSSRSGTTPAQDWMNYPPALRLIVQRLRGVVIENRPAAEVMGQHDGPHTLHYLDPPYLPETRSAVSRRRGGRCHTYRHEMDLADHEKLLREVLLLRGMVVISGYASSLYDQALPGWRRIQTLAVADGGHRRTEVLWLNPATDRELGSRLPLEAGI